MVISVRKRAVGVFPSRREAEQALHELKNSGFLMDKVSVIARDADKQEDIAGTPVQQKVGDKADEGAAVGAVSGGVVGGLTGLLIGLGSLVIPGVGPIMLAGATATALATTFAGAGIGAAAGSLIGALIGLGIPEERARVYNERVRRGEYLVLVDGTDEEIAQARVILERRGIQEFGIYNHPEERQPTAEGTHRKQAIGYFSLLQDAEAAIQDLRNAGFPLRQISLIHREPVHRETFAGIHLSDRFDPTSLGLSEPHSRFYNERIYQGDYIIIVSGTEAEIQHAATILSQHGVQQWQIYEPNGHVTASTPIRIAEEPAVTIIDHRQEAV
jgi:uncharacterized membrane protein